MVFHPKRMNYSPFNCLHIELTRDDFFVIFENLYDFIPKIDEFGKIEFHSRLVGFDVLNVVFCMLEGMFYLLLKIREG